MAHGDDEGTLGEVGDGPEPANLTKMAGGSEVEDDGDGGDGVRGCSGASLRCISEQMERLGSTC